MRRCLICGGEYETASGLARHRRAKHRAFRGPNRLACEEMLAVLDGEGRIEDHDAARLQMLRSLADQLDADPSNAQMWKVYRDTVDDLVGADDDSDTFTTLLQEINSCTPLGDAPEV